MTPSTKSSLKQSLQWRVLVNTISNYIGKIASLVTWFFLTPYILHKLGDDQYGIWVLIGSLVAYGSLLDLGIAGAITKYVAEHTSRGDYPRARQMVATALWLYSAIGLLAILIGFGVAPFFPVIFKVPLAQVRMISWAVILSGIGLGISLPAVTTTAVLRGLQRFDLLNIISITGTLLNAAAMLIVLELGWGLIGVIAINIPITILMQIPALWMIQRVAPQLRFGFSGARREDIRTVVSFSSLLFLINISGLLQQKTDEVVVGAYLPIRAVTPYSIAHRLSDLPQLLTDQFMKILMPLASQLGTDQTFSKLQSMFIISTRLTLAAFLPVGGAIVILAKPFIRAWVGQEYTSYINLVYLLALAGLVNTVLWPAGSILQGIARHRVLAYSALGSGILNLIISLILIRPLGLVGVALGTLIPTILEFLIVFPYTWVVLNVRWQAVMKDILFAALVPAIPMVACLFLLRELIQPASLVSVAFIAAIGMVVYLISYLFIRGNQEERRFAIDLFQSGRQLARNIVRRPYS